MGAERDQCSQQLRPKDEQLAGMEAAHAQQLLDATLAASAAQQAFAEEAAREQAAAKQSAQAARLAEVNLMEERRLREQETAAARGQVEQFRFAADDRARQLQERSDALAKKEQEVKDLLRQLAAVGDSNAPLVKPAEEPPPEAVVTSFEVMFALQGSLGIEFQRLAAPYVVVKILPNKVATDLGLLPGDELVAVENEPVTEVPWEGLVQRLGRRPVVAKFLRDPRRQQPAESEGGGQMGGLMSSMSSVAAVVKSAVPGKAMSGASQGGTGGSESSSQDQARLVAEVERLTTLLKARDGDVLELENQLKQRAEALKALEAGDTGAEALAGLAQEKELLAQQVQQLKAAVEEADKQSAAMAAEQERAAAQLAEEVQTRHVLEGQVSALTEQRTSLMTQFESLRNTCGELSAESQQKVGLESQVQELLRMNAQWQEAHGRLTAESEGLRSRVTEGQQLQSEVVQLRHYERACVELEQRLRDTEAQLEAVGAEMAQSRETREGDQATISRLQTVVESIQDSGESQAGQFEAELLERSHECSTLRRSLEEERRKVEELIRMQRDCQGSAEAGRALQAENETLAKELEQAKKEQEKLSGIVERCLEKMERESRERPHLVDKRMVTQMLAAYLEQRDHPTAAQEIMFKMADLLGFTTAEREQVGLSMRRRTLLEQQDDPASLSELTDRFVDFLLEESEAG